jgi:hypothetical protein
MQEPIEDKAEEQDNSLFVTKNNWCTTILWKEYLVSLLDTQRYDTPIPESCTSTRCNHHSWIQLQMPK